MYFQECESLATEYPTLRESIQKVDELLSSQNSSSILNLEDIRSVLSEKRRNIQLILDKLVEKELLQKLNFIECQECDNLIPNFKHDKSLIEDEELFCTQCHSEILYEDIIKVHRYKIHENRILKNSPKEDEIISIKEDKSPKDNLIHFGIITALPIELKAVLSYLEDVRECKIDNRIYYTGIISSNGCYCNITVVMPDDMGKTNAILATRDLIHNFDPKVIVLLGIAAGMPDEDIGLGDVVFATQIIDYDLRKEYDTHEASRPETYRASSTYLNLIKSYAWDGNVGVERPVMDSKISKLMIGPIAIGSVVVASEERREYIKNFHSKILAIEMESGGVAAAAHQSDPPKEFIVIKAISDFANSEKDDDWHPYSAHASAKFFFDFLREKIKYLDHID